MTLWEWHACNAGVARFHSSEDRPAAPTPDELDAAVMDFHRNNPWTQ